MGEFRLQVERNVGAAIICAALILLITGFGLATRVQAQTTTTIGGQLFNGTRGASPDRLADQSVTLFQVTASGPTTRTVQTDASGHFTVGDVTADANTVFFARLDYAGLRYFSEIVPADVAATSPITLTVYETQTLPANFQIDQAHLVLDVGQKQLSGIELVQVTNASDRAFLLPLPVPANVNDVAFDDPRDQSRVVRNADGTLYFPILPTTAQVLFGVSLAAKPPTYNLTLPVIVSISQLNVLVAQAGDVRVSSAQLKAADVFTAPAGQKYWQLRGTNLPRNSTVSVAVSNLPGADTTPMVQTVVLVTGGLGALILLALPSLKRKKPALRGARAATNAVSERVARLQAIAALDDAFEADNLKEEEYRAQRAELKAELLNMTAHERE